MKTRKILIAMALCAVVAFSAVLWNVRFPALYRYYLWRLNHTAEESLIMNLNEDIESISRHIVPLLVRTYEDVNASQKSRNAAALGLMRGDKKRAKTLFLDKKDDELYPALYYYYLWRLNHTSEGSLIMDLNENVRLIAHHIVPLLLHTYEDVNAPRKSRNAAALALIEADKERAENLFLSFLENEDDEIVALAIWNLGAVRSDRPFDRISKLADHRNESIRSAVEYYLDYFNNAGDIPIETSESK
jgi:HEAT repeat protein